MSGRAATETWTTRRLLEWMTQRFESLSIGSPRVVAEMLLAHVLGCERLRLYMEAERPASPAELTRLRELVKRASEHEPVQYLVGTASFFSHEFLVDDSTLIPQPCTEELVTRVIEFLKRRHKGTKARRHEGLPDGDGAEAVPRPRPVGSDPSPSATTSQASGTGASGPSCLRASVPPCLPCPRIADIGTGTGCIAISLALQIPGARLVATDVSPRALDLSRRNAEKLNVADRIDFRAGSLLEPLRDDAEGFDVICSNPPYITDAEWESGQVEESVRRHVPASATRGGADGLDYIRPLIAGAPAVLRPGGLLALEIGYRHRAAVLDLVGRSADLRDAEVFKDTDGHGRVLLARKT